MLSPGIRSEKIRKIREQREIRSVRIISKQLRECGNAE